MNKKRKSPREGEGKHAAGQWNEKPYCGRNISRVSALDIFIQRGEKRGGRDGQSKNQALRPKTLKGRGNKTVKEGKKLMRVSGEKHERIRDINNKRKERGGKG